MILLNLFIGQYSAVVCTEHIICKAHTKRNFVRGNVIAFFVDRLNVLDFRLSPWNER
jgi:hypothetical protein